MDNFMDFTTFYSYRRIGIAWDFPTFAADNNGTDVLLWQDRQV